MSTKFLRATHKTTNQVVQGYDSDMPLALFKELEKLEGDTFNPNDWNYSLLNSKFEVIQKNWDWKNVAVSVPIEDYYRQNLRLGK